jgi:hypothetical protein
MKFYGVEVEHLAQELAFLRFLLRPIRCGYLSEPGT